jgi:hypothetical protein
MKNIFFLFLSTFSMAGQAELFFARNYEHSKQNFLAAAGELKLIHPMAMMGAIEVGGEKLTIDYFYQPALQETKKLIIITSGNHGVEAYAGSALQFHFMQNILPKMDLRQTGVLLIHALNPWGFKHHRRGTENNVNLNRNFDVTTDLFSLPNHGYEEVHNLVEPRKVVTCADSMPSKSVLWKMLVKKEVTQQSLVEALGSGQYNYPMGLNYGGDEFEEQVAPVISLLKMIATPYGSIFHIDLHTGLGKKNVLHIMTKKDLNATSEKVQSKLFLNSEKNFYEITPPGADGFYDIHGDYASILRKILPQDDRVIIGITAEFGTIGNGLVGKVITLNRLINENQGYYFGFSDGRVEEKVKDRFLDLFFPRKKKWREKLEVNGNYLLDKVVKRFIEL